MTPELVQAVARAIEQSLLNARLVPGDKSPYTPEALAAIALIAPILRAQALEEAAEVAKNHWWWEEPKDIAAAIRALIPSGADPASS